MPDALEVKMDSWLSVDNCREVDGLSSSCATLLHVTRHTSTRLSLTVGFTKSTKF